MTTQEIKNIESRLDSLTEQFGDLVETIDEFHTVSNAKNLSDAVMHTKLESGIGELTETTKAIFEQTKKTNGRVTNNETWRFLIVGGGVVAITTVVPLLIWFYQTNLSEAKLHEVVARALQDELNQYDIEIQN